MNQFLDPLQYGWELDDGNLVERMTSLNIAPLEVVELVVCKCNKGNINLISPRFFVVFLGSRIVHRFKILITWINNSTGNFDTNMCLAVEDME